MARLPYKEKNLGQVKIRYAVSRKEPCMIAVLYVNGISASLLDFGTVRDTEASLSNNFFGCMKRRFLPFPYVPNAILEKVKLNRADLEDLNTLFEEIINRDKCDECYKLLFGDKE